MELGQETVRELSRTLHLHLMIFALAMARGIGMAVILPVFTRLSISGFIRNAVVLALALPLVPFLAGEVGRLTELPLVTFTALLAKEAFVGLLLGLLFGLPFFAAEAAGSAIELQRGSFGSILDSAPPDQNSSIAATFFVLLTLALFFAFAGPTVMLDGFYRSYSLWPVTEFFPSVTMAGAGEALMLLDRIMRLGFLIAVPIIMLFLFSDLVLGLIGRSAPQLNIFDLSFSFKGLVFTLVLPVYLFVLIDHLEHALGVSAGAIEQLRLLLR